MPGGVPELAKALLWTELALVLLVSLGRSAVYSVVNLVAALTAPGPLSAQGANLNNSLAPERPWLDLTFQLLRIGFAVVPVALAAYLLVRSGTRLREVWARDGGWAGVGDVGRGALLALGVGSVGVVFYLAAYATRCEPDRRPGPWVPDTWWRIPILIAGRGPERRARGSHRARLPQPAAPTSSGGRLFGRSTAGPARCCGGRTTSTRASAGSSAT